MAYARGDVVRGPDLFADHGHRPYICLSDERHPFSDEESLYAAVTTTARIEAVRLTGPDFECGTLPRESYVNPWTIVSIRHADTDGAAARLRPGVVDRIATEAARYLGVD